MRYAVRAWHTGTRVENHGGSAAWVCSETASTGASTLCSSLASSGRLDPYRPLPCARFCPHIQTLHSIYLPSVTLPLPSYLAGCSVRRQHLQPLPLQEPHRPPRRVQPAAPAGRDRQLRVRPGGHHQGVEDRPGQEGGQGGGLRHGPGACGGRGGGGTGACMRRPWGGVELIWVGADLSGEGNGKEQVWEQGR